MGADGQNMETLPNDQENDNDRPARSNAVQPIIWSRPPEWTKEDEEELARMVMPDEWARACAGPGPSKRKKRVRQRAILKVMIASLEAAGASCKSCKHRVGAPETSSYEWVCQLGDERGGVYQPIEVIDLCSQWAIRLDS